MIWRSRARWVMRVEDTYWVFDHTGVVVGRHEPSRFESGDVYFVDHYVRNNELVERTARGRRWAKQADTAVLVKGLRSDSSDAALEFLRSMVPQMPELEPLVDQVMGRRAKLTELGAPEVLDVDHRGVEFRRAHVALLDRVRTADDVYTRVLRMLVLLGRANPSAASLIAFARAALLLCEEDEVPEIDEQSVPVTSPLAESVAEMAVRLDDEDEGKAADAMHTCALLLGHREAK